jgi:hypothetical protein
MIRAARNGSCLHAHTASPHPPQGGLGRPLKHNAPTLCAVGRTADCPGLRPRIMGAMFKCPPQRA